ncbi:MAG: beta-propeller fold lactonase family protein, partial [Planctomycetaceae bacterium]|nr:beta-propeller fold lactonase family protein [Planctomycetaceae bacterium]
MAYRKSKRKQQNHLIGAMHAHIESMEDRVLLAGELGYLEALKDGVGGVDGVNFVTATDTSPDGKHVYSVGGVNNISSGNEDDNAIAVFSRDSTTGQLTYLQSLFDDDDTNNPGTADGLLSGRDVKVSPDGKHVYTAGNSDDAVGIFSRDASTGLLTYVSAVFDGIGTDGLNGATSIALSPDGTSLYVAGRDDDAVAVFSRNSTTGALTFVQSVFNNVGGVTGLDRILSVKVSPDGKHVYTAAGGNRNFTGSDAIGVFERNQSTGVLTFVDSYFEGDAQGEDTISGLDDLTDLVLSPDGSFLYAASHGYPQGSPDPWIAIFTRNDLTGELTWTSVANTFDLPASFPTYSDPDETSLVLSQDGAFMYATIGGQVVRMARDAGTGNLTYDSAFVGLDNLAHLYAGYDKISIDPSGRHLYVPDKATDSIIVLTTDLDFGDAPDPNYATLRANNGARHVAVGPILGASRDIDLDGQVSDDEDGNDDEDGLVNPTGDLNLVRGVAPSIDVQVSNTYGEDATLFGWIDYNGDGIFDNATEQASVVVANGTVDGVVTLEFPKVPADAVLGQTAARFRISTDYAFLQSPSPIGAASDGEVEDYTATIRSTGVLLFDPGTGRWRMGTSDGSSFLWTNGPKWNPTAGWTTFTGDYNGDGLTDGIGINNQNAVFFARNNGDGTMSTVSAGSFSSLEMFQHIMVGDFDGDGRDDLIVQQATNNTTPLPGSWFVKAWNGSAFTTSFFGRWEAADWVG